MKEKIVFLTIIVIMLTFLALPLKCFAATNYFIPGNIPEERIIEIKISGSIICIMWIDENGKIISYFSNKFVIEQEDEEQTDSEQIENNDASELQNENGIAETKEMYLLAAQREEEIGEYENAGFHYRDAEFIGKAKEMFLKAAQKYEEEKAWDRAAFLYELSLGATDIKTREMYLNNAEDFEEREWSGLAAFAYLKAGFEREAKEIFEEMNRIAQNVEEINQTEQNN